MIHQYKLGGYNIVLDVCSGAVHAVDEVAYDMIGMFEDHDRDAVLAAINEKYAGKDGITAEEIAEICLYAVCVLIKVEASHYEYSFKNSLKVVVEVFSLFSCPVVRGIHIDLVCGSTCESTYLLVIDITVEPCVVFESIVLHCVEKLYDTCDSIV